jgi:predicted N-formylglutamate amidohydrolase
MTTMSAPAPSDRAPLLSDGDPAPFEELNADSTVPLLLLCDHAGREIPHSLGRLGLDAAALDLHVAWDVGAGALTHRLARRTGAAAILGVYSRLVIDLNRAPGSPTSILAESDGVVVPGNRELDEWERGRREEEIFRPYHDHVAARLDCWRQRERSPAVVAVHSFTPHMNGFDRPWHVGVLWEHDGRIAIPLMSRLQAQPEMCVGDNEPYSAHDPEGYTLRAHCGGHGALPHVLLEIRQDLIDTPDGVAAWTAILDEALGEVLHDIGLEPGGRGRDT